jgi:Uma2 family endonuclease
MVATGTAYRFTVQDLERMDPQTIDDTRYEIIDGELHVSTQPSPDHQYSVSLIMGHLHEWGGVTLIAPGIVYAADEAVAPDIVRFASPERYRAARNRRPDRKLDETPDLVIEVLSPGKANQRRDLEDKLAVYDRRGAAEYWIADWRARTVRIHRREGGALKLVATLSAEDTLESPLLPGFAVRVAELFPPT